MQIPSPGGFSPAPRYLFPQYVGLLSNNLFGTVP
jgi:hypothetical protein